ncbi:GAF domain-containing protein [Zavarzinia sp.]|uniref:GAF domain-containing protein n=1 Tax=Zavarzinia sp. TaxID=2027920 RepID=UPI003569E20A
MNGRRLRDLAACFEGVIPSIIATVDGMGVPNVSYLSHVHYLDDGHVALSNQFFSKTAANVRAGGRAALIVVDGRSGEQFLLEIAFVEAKTAGPLFERMALHLEAMSAQQGMAGVMALRSADIYRVLTWEPVPAPSSVLWSPAPPGPDAADRLAASTRLAAEIAACRDADAMIDRVLQGMADDFGIGHMMVLIPDEDGTRLSVMASRGYDTLGIGAEVALGDGVIGLAAKARLPLRLADISRGRRYAAAVRQETAAETHSVPYPGLAEPLSQMAIPLLGRGQLLGLVFAESPRRFAFTREDENALALVAGHLAAGLALQEAAAGEAPAPAPAPPPVPAEGRLRIRYYPFDDSIFLGEDYLVRGIPGRLLHHFLRAHLDEGRTDFTNREIRMDPRLRLPEVKDNLETRLILLRRRLDERAAPIRLSRPGRGQIRLELDGTPEIEVVT